MEYAPGETAELVLTIQDLHGVSSADALALEFLQLVDADEGAPAVGIAPTRPGIMCGRVLVDAAIFLDDVRCWCWCKCWCWCWCCSC